MEGWRNRYHSGRWILRPEFQPRGTHLFITFCQTGRGKISNIQSHRKPVKFRMTSPYQPVGAFRELHVNAKILKLKFLTFFEKCVLSISPRKQPVYSGNGDIHRVIRNEISIIEPFSLLLPKFISFNCIPLKWQQYVYRVANFSKSMQNSAKMPIFGLFFNFQKFISRLIFNSGRPDLY